jgi:hypothetical protein
MASSVHVLHHQCYYSWSNFSEWSSRWKKEILAAEKARNEQNAARMPLMWEDNFLQGRKKRRKKTKNEKGGLT